MKKLKIVFTVCALLFTAMIGFAQEREAPERLTPEQRADKMVQRMDKDLTLTDDQKQRLKALHMQNENMRKSNRELAIKKMEEHRKKVDDVLTPEQRIKHKEMLEKHKQDGRKPRPMNKPQH